MTRKTRSTTLYSHPFSRAYWRDAAAELSNVKILVFAALMIALRVVMKSVAIPLAPGLKINTAFLVNSLGAMVFGPVVAAICAVITDVLGYLLNPEGIYFVPFLLTEVAGSMIFALFLYRAKVTPVRTMLSRFCICFFVNVVIQTPIYMWYYALFMGGKSYVLTLPSIIKNLFMFPIESVVLTFFLSIMIPITNRLGLTHTGADAKKALAFTKKQIALLLVLVVVGVGAVGGYLTYHYQTTSLTTAYGDTRADHNKEMLPMVQTNETALKDEKLVTIIDDAKKAFLGSEITYTVSVYSYEEMTEEELSKAWALSKSGPTKDPYVNILTKVGVATIVVNEGSGEVISFAFVAATTPAN